MEPHSELLSRSLVMEMPAMHEKVITTESDICRYVPNDREYAIKKTFMSGALALLVVAYCALASAQTVAEMWTVQWPGLEGGLESYPKMQCPDWGLGVNIRALGYPHWCGDAVNGVCETVSVDNCGSSCSRWR